MNARSAQATANPSTSSPDHRDDDPAGPYSVARWRAYLDAHPPTDDPDVRLKGQGWSEFWVTRTPQQVAAEARRWDAPIGRPEDPYPTGARIWRIHRRTTR